MAATGRMRSLGFGRLLYKGFWSCPPKSARGLTISVIVPEFLASKDEPHKEVA